MILFEVFARLFLQLAYLCFCLLLVGRQALHGELLVKEVGGKVVQVNEFHSCLFHYFAEPLSVTVIASLDLAAGPLIAWRQRNEDRRGTLLAHIINHLLQVPTEAVDHLIAAVVHLIDVAGVPRTGYHAACLLVGNRADVVVSELNGNKIAGLQ